MGDRESDLYELFATERPDGVDSLIRAARNRCVRHPQEYLWETVQAAAPLGGTDLLVYVDRPELFMRVSVIEKAACLLWVELV